MAEETPRDVRGERGTGMSNSESVDRFSGYGHGLELSPRGLLEACSAPLGGDLANDRGVDRGRARSGNGIPALFATR